MDIQEQSEGLAQIKAMSYEELVWLYKYGPVNHPFFRSIGSEYWQLFKTCMQDKKPDA